MKRVFPVVIAVIIGALIIGGSYRVLRFLANYQESIVTITNCKPERVRGRTGPDAWQQFDYFSFELETDKLSYPINVNENAEISFWDALRFKEAKPTKDWCRIVGTSIPVLHYDKLEVVVPYGGDRVGGIQLLYKGFGVGGLLVVGVVLLAGIMLGVVGAWYLIVIAWSLNLRLRREESESSPGFVIRYLQQYVTLVAVFLIALAFTVGLEWAFLKGMLYVESSNNLVTGVSVSIVLTLACFSPGTVLQGVYNLRTSRAPFVLLIRDVLFLVVLFKPTYGTWQFVMGGETEPGTMFNLIKEIILAALS